MRWRQTLQKHNDSIWRRNQGSININARRSSIIANRSCVSHSSKRHDLRCANERKINQRKKKSATSSKMVACKVLKIDNSNFVELFFVVLVVAKVVQNMQRSNALKLTMMMMPMTMRARRWRAMQTMTSRAMMTMAATRRAVRRRRRQTGSCRNLVLALDQRTVGLRARHRVRRRRRLFAAVPMRRRTNAIVFVVGGGVAIVLDIVLPITWSSCRGAVVVGGRRTIRFSRRNPDSIDWWDW